jgi:hypothetical protein
VFETKKALIVVRTYPTPARKGLEVSCTAAVTEDGKWLRLFPVPYRLLEGDKKFHKYQWIEVETEKASDPRPESHKIRPPSIRLLGEPLSTDHAWKNRKHHVEPLRAHCLCCLKDQRNKYGFPTLGFIRPKRITKLICKPQSPFWNETQAAALSQGDLFDEAPEKELQKIPFNFIYEFECDHPNCNGHRLSCTDWEMSESYRKWSLKYGTGWEDAFRQKYEKELISECDLSFFVGTIAAHPAEWIIVGLFYPPKFAPLPLFGE